MISNTDIVSPGLGKGNMKWEEEEEELVGERSEEVWDPRGPVCSAVLTDLPKLRGTTGYFTTNLNTTHAILSGGLVRILSLLTNVASFQSVSFSYIHCICLNRN